MPKPKIWSKNANDDISQLLDYLVLNWGNKFATNYLNLVEELISHISISPKLYPTIHTKNRIRKCVVSKHNSIYYREGKEHIEIINVFDTRQNPKKIKFK